MAKKREENQARDGIMEMETYLLWGGKEMEVRKGLFRPGVSNPWHHVTYQDFFPFAKPGSGGAST